MKKYFMLLLGMTLMLLLCSVSYGDVPIDEAHFPDEKFRAYVNNWAGGDGILSDNDIARITFVSLYGKQERYYVSSLKGIEYLTALTELTCYYCDNLTELDLSRNTELVELECSNNNIRTLDLQNNTHLRRIRCVENQMTSLTLGSHPDLTYLNCRENNIASLNVSGAPVLIEFDCYSNDITELDLSGCTALLELNCSYNKLSALNLSSNTGLLKLSCTDNLLTELDLSNNPSLLELDCYRCLLEEMNLRQNAKLLKLTCHRNQLKTLDLSGNPELVYLVCQYNELTELDLSNNIHLVQVNCLQNLLTSLNLTGCNEIIELLCNRNQLEHLDLSSCTSLSLLHCGGNNLTSLNLEGCEGLTILQCDKNSITHINTLMCPKLAIMFYDESTDIVINPEVTNRNIAISPENFPDDVFREAIRIFDEDGDGYFSPLEIASVEELGWIKESDEENILSMKGIEYFVALTGLGCWSCDLEELDLSGLPRIERLYLPNNKLISIDVKACKMLIELDVDGNLLTELDLSGYRRLSQLQCDNNRLKTLNIDDTPSLWILQCNSNDITELDLSNRYLLEFLACRENKLRTLNADNCTRLWSISCMNNELVSLSVQNCTRLDRILCTDNKLEALDLSTNNNLDSLFCHNNSLTKLDVSNTILTQLSCTDNPLAELITENCPYLTELWCYNASLDVLDVSGCSSLEKLVCYKNNLSHLDVSHNPELRILNCWDNKFTALDVHNLTKLQEFYCSGNQLTDIDVSANTSLLILSCARNQIRTLNLSNNKELLRLYCYDNQLRTLNLKDNPKLFELACSDNSIINLDLSSCPKLLGLDCSANYITELDLKANKELQILWSRYTTISSLDVSGLEKLRIIKLNNGSLTNVDLSSNTALYSFDCTGSRFEGMYITFTDSIEYPYKTDIRMYAGNDLSRVSNVKAFNRTNEEVNASFDREAGIVKFAAMPVKMTYDYDTGNKSADMSVTVSLPTRSFIYLPKVQPVLYGEDEYMHTPKISTGTDSTGQTTVSVTYAAHYVGHASLYDIRNASQDASFDVAPYVPNERENNDNPVTPIKNESDDNQSVSSSSGGGCNSGLGFLTAIIILPFIRRKKELLVLALVVITSSAYADVIASDYTLPIQLENYVPAGTWSTNFTLTNEMRDIIAQIRGVTSDKVHSFADIILSDSWSVQPSDLYNLSRNGEYGGVILPITSNAASSDYYVILCTFSNDVKPGEQLSVQGFEVSADTKESVYTREHSYSAATWVTLDENLNRIEYVPNNRRVYLAVSFAPEYINTGILTVIRGTYVEEDNPLERLDPDFAQRIADDLGIPIEKLQYVSRAYIGAPKEPTDAMKNFVKSNDREIILNMPVVSIDEGYEGAYFIYTLPDDIWEEVKDKKIDDYTIYALNDSEVSGAGKVKSSFIFNGLISLWELNGGKMKTFSVKEFVIAGLLQSGTPFSLYLTKILLALLMGGCTSGVNPAVIPIAIMGIIFVKFLRRH